MTSVRLSCGHFHEEHEILSEAGRIWVSRRKTKGGGRPRKRTESAPAGPAYDPEPPPTGTSQAIPSNPMVVPSATGQARLARLEQAKKARQVIPDQDRQTLDYGAFSGA